MSQFRWELLRPPLDYPRVPYHGLLRRTVERTPDKRAIVFHDQPRGGSGGQPSGASAGQMLSFRDIEGLSNSLAHALLDLRVEKGDRVALFMSNRPEYVISLQAVSKVGAAITPINPAYHEQEAEYQLNDSEARVVIVHEDRLPVIAAIRDRTPSVKHVVVIGSKSIPNTVSWYDLATSFPGTPPPEVSIDVDEDIVALPYSSGTTGLPKGVMLTHRNLVCNHIQCISSGRITERDVMLIFLPFYHIYGTMLMGAAVASGATQVILEKFDPIASLTLTERHGVTLFYAVPPVLLALTQNPELKKYSLDSVRYIMSGAAPLPPEVARRMQELTDVQVLQGYGLTEASPLTHLNPVDNPELIRSDSVGIRMSDQQEKIVDPDDPSIELGPDDVGELVIRGPHVMKGYWKAPEENARALRGGWLHTGDIARRDALGYLYIVDRKKEMIKYKGFGVAPAELEALLHEHPAVADCAVVPMKDPEAGEIPRAFIVVRPGAPLTAAEVMRFVEERVAGYKKIRSVEFIDEIPKNPSGKILRRVLKDRA